MNRGYACELVMVFVGDYVWEVDKIGHCFLIYFIHAGHVYYGDVHLLSRRGFP